MSAYGLHVDDRGNATFTGFSLNGFNIGGAATNVSGLFVIRIDRFGNLAWATHDGNYNTPGVTMSCDVSGNSYVLATLLQESPDPKFLCGTSVTGWRWQNTTTTARGCGQFHWHQKVSAPAQWLPKPATKLDALK